MTVLAYGYMVLSWGGYSFVINLLPIYCLAAILFGRLNARLYIAFAPLVVIGTVMAASVPVRCRLETTRYSNGPHNCSLRPALPHDRTTTCLTRIRIRLPCAQPRRTVPAVLTDRPVAHLAPCRWWASTRC